MKKFFPVVIVMLLAFQGIANAKEIKGTVTAIDSANSKISISYASPEGVKTQAEVSVKPETVFTGLSSLNELKGGEEVTIDASEDASGALNAVSIAVSQALSELPLQKDVKKVEEAVPAP